jgi:hypothetical protein
MRAVKLSALEQEFAAFVQNARKKEMGLIRSTATVQGFTFSMYFGLVTTCTCGSLIVFTVNGGILTATNVFVTMMLFASTRLLLGWMVPVAIQVLFLSPPPHPRCSPHLPIHAVLTTSPSTLFSPPPYPRCSHHLPIHAVLTTSPSTLFSQPPPPPIHAVLPTATATATTVV